MKLGDREKKNIITNNAFKNSAKCRVQSSLSVSACYTVRLVLFCRTVEGERENNIIIYVHSHVNECTGTLYTNINKYNTQTYKQIMHK